MPSLHLRHTGLNRPDNNHGPAKQAAFTLPTRPPFWEHECFLELASSLPEFKSHTPVLPSLKIKKTCMTSHFTLTSRIVSLTRKVSELSRLRRSQTFTVP